MVDHQRIEAFQGELMNCMQSFITDQNYDIASLEYLVSLTMNGYTATDHVVRIKADQQLDKLRNTCKNPEHLRQIFLVVNGDFAAESVKDNILVYTQALIRRILNYSEFTEQQYVQVLACCLTCLVNPTIGSSVRTKLGYCLEYLLKMAEVLYISGESFVTLPLYDSLPFSHNLLFPPLS